MEMSAEIRIPRPSATRVPSQGRAIHGTPRTSRVRCVRGGKVCANGRGKCAASAGGCAGPSRALSRGTMSMRRKLFVTLAVLATLGLLLYSARGHTSHYKMVDEVMIAYGQWIDRPLRVHGWVE